MTIQDVDAETYYAVGMGLFEKAGKLHDAFSVNVGILGTTASMAGTDDAGVAWAMSYDQRVSELLGTADDVIEALANYGGVVIQAGHNHAVAEFDASPDRPASAPRKPPEPPDAARALSAPPSAGGPGRGLLDTIGLLEQVGVPVPDGDTGKISAAAAAWERIATVYETTTIVEALQVDARSFDDTKSPEVTFLVRDLHELHDAVSSLLDGCAELAQSCREYESALDELRDGLQHILEELATELATTAAIAVAASFVSFGVGAIAGSAKAAQSISKFARIIAGVVGTWKLSKGIGNGVRRVRDIAGLRNKLQRLKDMGRRDSSEDGPPIAGVQRTSEIPLSTSRAQIESKFKHAEDFGVTEERGKSGFDAFERAISQHMSAPNTAHIIGTYRGSPAILNYNPDNGLVVVQSTAGEFISGWRVSQAQASNILNLGKLGGG